MPLEERDTTIDDFRRDVQSIYNVWLIDNALYIAAGNLYPLRAYDAIQLACAVAVRKDALLISAQICKLFGFVFSFQG
jgi:hypothetical protein